MTEAAANAVVRLDAMDAGMCTALRARMTTEHAGRVISSWHRGIGRG
jgi:hypothetical protein